MTLDGIFTNVMSWLNAFIFYTLHMNRMIYVWNFVLYAIVIKLNVIAIMMMIMSSNLKNDSARTAIDSNPVDIALTITKISPTCLTLNALSLKARTLIAQKINMESTITTVIKKISKKPKHTSIQSDYILLSSLSVMISNCSWIKNLGISLCLCCRYVIDNSVYTVTMLIYINYCRLRSVLLIFSTLEPACWCICRDIRIG